MANQRFDLVNYMAVKNRVTNPLLDDSRPQGSLLSMDNEQWLINEEQYQNSIEAPAKLEIKRILQTHMEMFKETLPIPRVLHQYSAEMSLKSEWVSANKAILF